MCLHVKVIKDTNSPPWINGEIRHLLRKKYRALKKYRENRTEQRKRKLRSLSNDIKILVRHKHRDYLNKIVGSFCENPKLFWSYHKAVLHHRSGVDSVITHNGQTAKTSGEKAELFNTYFCSVFTSPNTVPSTMPSNPNRSDVEISDVQLSVEEVELCLAGLDSSKASGPDGIPAHILKQCSKEIAPSLCALFNHSLRTGRFPAEWKNADVTPVHKKDRKEPAGNYRPISLLSIVSKVMERCVCNRFYAHVSCLITELEHGFMRNRSCVTQLLPVLHSIGKSLDWNTQTDMLYFDFAKAFDSVDHVILIQKLKWYGITGQLLNWFKDYLNHRYQRVVIDGVVSQYLPVTSGVPQGSLVGPLLFVIFINDLPDSIQEQTSSALYADDTKLYRSISSQSDCENLQRDISNLNTWSHNSNMKFNASKCKVLTVTRKKSPVLTDYHLDNAILQRVQQENDLGVIVNSKLSWDTHISSIVSKANRMLGLLKRTCLFITDTKVRRKMYLALVKSQLCYATEVWSPSNAKLQILLERVQRQATRWILRTKVGELSYEDRLKSLNLLPLTYDGEIRDLVLVYKCIFGHTDLNINQLLTFVEHNRSRAQNPTLMLKHSCCKTSTFQASFFNRIVKPWNYICKIASPEKFASLNIFKNFLRKTYTALVNSTFNVDMTCTWSLIRDCPCHRT